jgi:pimeloyl-ACP methyl ester carboxylesterase
VTTTPAAFTEETLQIADVSLQMRRGGSGDPLLILHGELGVPGWLKAYELLAEKYTVYVPSLPGFGETSVPDWLMSVRDLSAWTNWFIREYGISSPLNVIGFSLGGWVATEIATVNSTLFKKMVLVGAGGIKPAEGEIWDYFMNSSREAFEQSFLGRDSEEYLQYYGRDWSPEEGDQIETNREGAIRLLWRPYMHSITLPGLLPAIATPTLLVWGRQDAVVPISSCELYQKGIAGSQAKIIEDCGHMPEMEKPEEFAKAVVDFLAS